jgi:ATP-dependent DNA helicase DinG
MVAAMTPSRSRVPAPEGQVPVPDRLTRFLAPGTDAEIADRYAALPAAAADALDLDDATRELAFVDVETTGFDPASDRVIEIAVLVARGPEVLGRYASLVDPGVPIPREATQLTGIDDALVAGAPRIQTAVAEALDLIGERDIVAHNASFDEAFVLEAAGRIGRRVPGRWLDSLSLARVSLPRMRSHRLRDLAEAFGLPAAGHRAADDVEAMFGVWRVALAGLGELPADILAAIAGLSPGTDWPLRDTLRSAAAHGQARQLDLKRLRADRVRGHHAPGLADADERELVCPDIDEVRSEFAAAGAVGRMYEGFEPREEQVRMAEAVLEAFADRRHLAVEAGTGVGKSVAYLVPAARFAMENHLGVGVATKTNSLMDQLVYNELPRLSAALGGRLRFLALKGYEHYPCLRKVDRLIASAEGLDVETLANTAALLAWIAQSSWGDLDAVNVHWGPLRQRVACSVEECTRKRCRFHPALCYLHGVRRRAGSANVVVTNHALLFRDAAAAGGILPPLRYWVVDEAHSAESEAREQLSVCADHRALASLLGALHTEGRGGAVDALRARARTLAAQRGDDELVARIERLTAKMRGDLTVATTVSESFFDFLKDMATEESDYDSVQLHVTPLVRETTAWSVSAGVGHSLARRLESVLRGGRDLLTALEELDEQVADQRADLAGLLSRVGEQLAGLEAVLDGSDDSYVYSLHLSRRRDDARDSLSAAMLDVGDALIDRFFPEVHSVVFTSATIATGDDFGHFARTIGLDRLPGRGGRCGSTRRTTSTARCRSSCRRTFRSRPAGGTWVRWLTCSSVCTPPWAAQCSRCSRAGGRWSRSTIASRPGSRSMGCACCCRGAASPSSGCVTNSSPTNASRSSRPSPSGRASTRRGTPFGAS